MYFKINTTGCGEKKGLVEVRFDCYLSPLDYGYADHHVTVPVISEAYPGKVNEMGSPVDQKDYDLWISSLPTITRDNPFCCHFRCFEPDVTDEQIVKAGKEILVMSYTNHLMGDLRANANPKVNFTTNIVKIQASLSRVENVKTADFAEIAAIYSKERV